MFVSPFLILRATRKTPCSSRRPRWRVAGKPGAALKNGNKKTPGILVIPGAGYLFFDEQAQMICHRALPAGNIQVDR